MIIAYFYVFLYILFFFSNQESNEFLENSENTVEFPCAIALIQSDEISEMMVRYKQYGIIIPQRDFLFCITIIMALYYIFELNYPKRYLQAMGAFGWFTLEDKYYKLGARASRVVSNLLKKQY